MAEPRIFTSPDELRAAIGEQLGYTDWLEIDQQRIDQFAEATGDHQWIHVDPEQAASGPFGSTIAHGYLTLSLLPVLIPQLMLMDHFTMAINYGTEKVRFPSPVPVGSRLRATGVVTQVKDIENTANTANTANGTGSGIQVTLVVKVEREGQEKPVCVAESVSRYHF